MMRRSTASGSPVDGGAGEHGAVDVGASRGYGDGPRSAVVGAEHDWPVAFERLHQSLVLGGVCPPDELHVDGDHFGFGLG
jgi:hypothetical protein